MKKSCELDSQTFEIMATGLGNSFKNSMISRAQGMEVSSHVKV